MNLMKSTLRKLWRLTRATSIVVGLAVMVGLVAGIASLAVAQKSPSGGTTASPLLKGVENVAATTTTLINSGTGPAMSMRVQPGNPPLTVNTEAGTATNLSADEVDGKDATAFVSATNGKAPDSDKLDGKDSTEFLGATAKAADSDSLDGRDSTEFLGATAKATDSDKLDGKDSSDFAPAGTATAFTARTDSVTIPDDGIVVVVSKNVPAGSYAINAKVHLDNIDDDDSSFAGCFLSAGGTSIDRGGIDRLDENLEVNQSEQYALQAVVAGFGGGAITVQCSEIGGAFGDSDRVDAKDAVITAIRVGSVQ
jgi:hypothetical protein